MKKLFLIFIISCFAINAKSQSKNFIDQPYIEVNATFDTSFVPDEIYLSISISEADTKNKVSLEQLENEMIKAFQNLGINADKDLHVTDIQSNIKKYMLKQNDVMKSRSYELKVGNAVTAAKVFIALEKLGIGNSNIDHVGFSKIKEMENTCFTKAMLLARQKADLLSSSIGAKVGIVLFISEQSPDSYNGIGNISVKFVAPLLKADTEIDPAVIEFEKMSISRTVSVKFSLK